MAMEDQQVEQPSPSLTFSRAPSLNSLPSTRSYVSLLHAVAVAVDGRRRHFLVPIDDQPAAVTGLEWALANMYRAGDIIHLLHVVPEPATARLWTGVYAPPDEAAAEAAEVQATKDLATALFVPLLLAAKVRFKRSLYYEHSLEGAKSHCSSVRAALGCAKQQTIVLAAKASFQLHVVVGAINTSAITLAIIEEADLLRATAVILGSHLKSSLQELWSGSVANNVAKKLQRPCIIVRD